MTQKGRFKIDVYNCVIHVTVCDGDKSLLKSINYYLRKDKDEDELLDKAPTGYAYGPTDDLKNYYLFFNKNELTIENINHEKSHIIDYILKDRDLKNLSAVDETRSSLDGFISHKLTLFFTQRKLKVKNER